MNPPPVPPSSPAPAAALPPPPVRKSNTTVIVIICAVAALALFAMVGVLAAILIPTVGKVRETALRTVDQINLRQVAQAALIYASDHGGQLPPTQIAAADATIHSVAVALARFGGLNEGAMWFSRSDQAVPSPRPESPSGQPIYDSLSGQTDPLFAGESNFAWDFATGLTTSLSATTPVAWTRGLRPDGTWDAQAGVYGNSGGYIAFLGGNVQFFPDLRTHRLVCADGSTTSNLLEALPANARVVGAGPGTLHGSRGLAAAKQD